MKLSDKVIRRADLIAVSMGDETVMMDVVTGKYYKLSSVGGDIWNYIEQEITISDLIDKLLTEYDVTREECEKETIEFLEQLVSSGVIDHYE